MVQNVRSERGGGNSPRKPSAYTGAGEKFSSSNRNAHKKYISVLDTVDDDIGASIRFVAKVAGAAFASSAC